VHGAGDLNGDGKADIEWQNTDGTPAVWLMDDLGANWHVAPQHSEGLL
jgi:hypothetical protein